MMRHLSAATLAEFKQHCADLAAEHMGLQLYFRGQVHNYAPLPSELRSPSEAAERIRVHYRRDLWTNAVMAAVFEPGSSPSIDEIAASCLLQHYGFRSWFIDITSDANIALWFATRQYLVENKHVVVPAHRADEKHVDHPLGAVNTLQLPMARHVLAEEPGHVYVYAVDPRNPLFVDLQHRAPAAAERVRRQQGSGLFPSPDGGYDGLQVAHIELAGSITAEVAELQSTTGDPLTAEFLFPGPEEDGMYRLLLRLPRIAPEGDDSAGVRVAMDAFGVPLYESPSMLRHIPLLLTRAVVGTTSSCLTCLGLTAATVELPITGRGGSPREIFKHAHLKDSADGEPPGLTERALTRALEHSATTSSSGLSQWPAKQLFLRTHVLRDVGLFLMSQDPYPLVRGYELSEDQGGALRFRLIQEFEDGAITIYPDPSGPGFDLNRAVGHDLSAVEQHECSGGTEDKMCQFCELTVIALHAPWIHAYLEGVSEGKAFFRHTSENHFALYWLDPDGASPMGDPWSASPTVSGTMATEAPETSPLH